MSYLLSTFLSFILPHLHDFTDSASAVKLQGERELNFKGLYRSLSLKKLNLDETTTA